MTPEECRIFRGQNMKVKNKDVRVKLLAMSQENMWDYMDWHESELIHGWRLKANHTDEDIKILKTALAEANECIEIQSYELDSSNERIIELMEENN